MDRQRMNIWGLCVAAAVLIGAVLAETPNLDETRTHDWVVLVRVASLASPQHALSPWQAEIVESRTIETATGAVHSSPTGASALFFAASPTTPTLGIFHHSAMDSTIAQAMLLPAYDEASGGFGLEYYDRVKGPHGDHSHDDADNGHEHRHAHGHDLLGGGSTSRNTTMLTFVLRDVPASVDRLVAVVNHRPSPDIERSGSADATATTVHRSAFHALSYAESTEILMQQRGIVVTTLQEVSRTATRSIVFLAAGYTLAERTKFNADVATCVAALRGEDATLSSLPWSRYAALLNLYSLFEPSLQSGASRLRGPGHDCSGMTSCGPTTVQTNLGCAFGSPEPARLGCRQEAVLSLASFSPAPSDIIVVLVNDGDVGGSAFASVATVSTAATYLSYQLLHQLNHAVAALGDEYSYGFSESNLIDGVTVPPNCASTSAAPLLDWSYWISLGTVPEAPTAGCTYSNLYRPTKDACIMSTASATSMCSVCKERLSRQLFRGGAGMSIDQPRCPPASWDIYVNASGSATLSVNHYFVGDNADVSILWLLHDGSQVSSVPTITISGSTLAAGVNTVRAIVTDNSPLVRFSRRVAAMNITTTFTLRLWQSTSSCTAASCTSSSGVAYTYCRQCNTGTCTEAVVTPVTYAAPSAHSIDQEAAVVNTTAIVLACVGALIFLVTGIVIVFHTSKRPRLVYDPSSGEQSLRIAVLITGCIGLALIVIMIVFAVFYLPQAAVFGRGVFIGCIVLAAVVYLVAILKIVAAVFRSAALSAVCGVVLCVFGAGLFGIGVFGVYVYRNRGTEDLVRSFAELWLDYTASNPALVCDVQRAFACSGFYHSCTPVTSSYCPSNCAQPNRDYVNACQEPWMDWVIARSLRVGIVCLICGFFFAIAAVIDCLHCVRTMRAKANARGRRSYRKDERAPVVPITTNEVEQFRTEFRRADTNNAGTLEGQEVVDFVTEVFGDAPSGDEQKLLMTAGPLSCEELLRMYFPHYVLAHIDPRQLTPEEAEEASDAIELQRLQYEKLNAFMGAAGALSPEALYRLYQEYAMTRFATTGKEILDVIRNAATRHATTDEAAMCSGLSKHELEGLRGAWIAIHPSVVGDLDDDELDKLFQWTHGTVLHSHEHFVRWKDMLDVRKTDVIGWGEFCYPYAQRSRLSSAREYLFSVNREVPHEMLTKAQVAEEFGPQLVDECFMIFEEIIPVERVVEYALKLQQKHNNL